MKTKKVIIFDITLNATLNSVETWQCPDKHEADEQIKPIHKYKNNHSKMVPWLSHIHKEGNDLCFIYTITYGCTTFTSNANVIYLLLAHWWFNSYAPKLVPIFYYRNKTQVQMFYFLSTIDGPEIPIIWFYLLKRSVKSPLMHACW